MERNWRAPELATSLLPQHQALLDGSAVHLDVAIDRGYRSIEKKSDLQALGFSASQCSVPGLLAPITKFDGSLGSYQYRPDQPRIDERGRAVKYETPRGSRLVLDVPIRCRPNLADSSLPLLITEGSRKADSAVSAGYCCIAISGVWNWRGRSERGGLTSLGDWEAIALKGRPVYLAFDSDMTTNQSVHTALVRLQAFLKARGAEVKILCLDAELDGSKVGLDDFLAGGGDLDQLLANAAEAVPPLAAEEETELPVIRVNGRQLRDKTADVLSAMALVNQGTPRYFNRGHIQIRLSGSRGDRWTERMTPEIFSYEVGRAADFVRVRRDGEEPTDPPMSVVRDALVHEAPFPKIRGLVKAPVYVKPGRLLSVEGYDPASELYLDFGPWANQLRTTMPVADALKLLFGELLIDFPFSSRASKAHMLGLLVTPFVRDMIDGPTPLFLIEAPTRGTGKTLLAETVGEVVTGGTIPALPLPKADEEIDKRITAHLIDAPVITLWDNVADLSSPILALLLTAGKVRGRILGSSQMLDVQNDTVWMATGNNVRMSEELARRVVKIRLDAEVEAPDLRTVFKHRLPEWTRSNRPVIVSAVLSIIRAWVEAECPKFQARVLGKFEDWTQTVGGIVEFAGVMGFLSDRSSEISPDQNEWRRAAVLWWQKYGDEPVAANEILELMKFENLQPDLWANHNHLSSLQRIGKALTRNTGRWFGEYVIRSGGNESRARNNTYKLEVRTPETPAATEEPISQGAQHMGVSTGVVGSSGENNAANPPAKAKAVATVSDSPGVSGVLPAGVESVGDALRFRVDR